MPAAEPNDEHLAELRRRWESEPDSRVFLQLAEEYRRRERYGDAAEVLESGLAKHPNHVSAHVALGRVQLALGDAGRAAGSLERALSFDATNLVANKALVEAHLARGERDLARQRLDIYRLLNESDPAIDDLERRLRAGSAPAAPAAAAAGAGLAPAGGFTAGESGSETKAAEAASKATLQREGAEMTFSDSTASAGTEGGYGTAGAHRPEAHPPEAHRPEPRRPPVPAPFATGTPDGDPFGELDTPEARRLYLEALGSEGLFAVPEPVEEPAAATAGEATADAAPPTPQATATAAAPEPSAAISAPAPEASPASAPSPTVAPTPTPASTQRTEATVTLGRLYLEQGHPQRAREIFAAVLDGDPDNAAAREGLARAAATRPAPVTARELLEDADPDQPVRTALLHAYLARLRRGRSRHDVS